MDIFLKVLMENIVILLLGILFVATRLITPKFKLYQIICRNGLTKRDYDSINFRYIEKYAGLFALSLGIVTIIDPFLWIAVDKVENIQPTLWGSMLLTSTLMLILGLIIKEKFTIRECNKLSPAKNIVHLADSFKFEHKYI